MALAVREALGPGRRHARARGPGLALAASAPGDRRALAPSRQEEPPLGAAAIPAVCVWCARLRAQGARDAAQPPRLDAAHRPTQARLALRPATTLHPHRAPLAPRRRQPRPIPRRRLCAFICADWQPEGFLREFLTKVPIGGAAPLEALRALLFDFPFLPIDAGAGADRVISVFALAFARQAAADQLAALGLGTSAAERAVRLEIAVYL